MVFSVDSLALKVVCVSIVIAVLLLFALCDLRKLRWFRESEALQGIAVGIILFTAIVALALI